MYFSTWVNVSKFVYRVSGKPAKSETQGGLGTYDRLKARFL